ncbi:Acetyl-coenzyme A synthetase 1 [Rhodococcus sp. RD6.2]|jgi:acetoacetyl-CoA synthetase|uniref:acetoacetate--CoA ligase n=1 Tax=Rhodococcus sp. RD6.2 TaxID=260936 RepID=UPI00063BB664|nr:acetoacetate--CoA ligase [Rhodococcus sp. RD6.2]CRK52778.1 Acetyl-coenzyme A synthetase 1 [Rhodococcus sp. RD6.2]
MVEPQWVPSDEDVAEARLTDFVSWVQGRCGVTLADYQALWRWSVNDLDDFWQAVWEYFEVQSTTPPGAALVDDSMPGAHWFPEARVNYVRQALRHQTRLHPAIRSSGEDTPDVEVSWEELRRQVGALASTLKTHGVGEGDRVVGYLPNIPEAIVAFLATASLGAVWAACGQDYSAAAALTRLGQLDPTVLIAADGYRFGGRAHRRDADVAKVRAGLPGLRLTVRVERLGGEAGDVPDGLGRPGAVMCWEEASAGDAPLDPVDVPFDHPLWVVFSSGTTGLPKGIVHGHGGVMLEHLKSIALQNDIGPTDALFWYTSPSWMMWNFQVAALLVGATIVCYDGSPSHPAPDTVWDIASRQRATMVGTSPGYVLACAKAGVVPRADHDLGALRAVGITGSSLPASSSLWLSENVGESVPVFSISGGTDVVTAFAGGVRTVPVWPGELSVPYLGVALDAFDEQGRPVRGQVGELVVTRPMPSMPVRFWNDPDGEKYRGAYYGVYPGVWRHGDWITITDRGSVVVHGRSDSTLNRNGIRMGSADIYQVVEGLPEIAEALVLGVEQSDGGYWMPLFVVLADGAELDDALRGRIAAAVRDQVSPRHVPDEIIAAPGIPHTRTGKKLEVPIKRILQGGDPTTAVDRSAVDAPDLVDWYTAQRP